jgi:hypothetical protein
MGKPLHIEVVETERCETSVVFSHRRCVAIRQHGIRHRSKPASVAQPSPGANRSSCVSFSRIERFVGSWRGHCNGSESLVFTGSFLFFVSGNRLANLLVLVGVPRARIWASNAELFEFSSVR